MMQGIKRPFEVGPGAEVHGLGAGALAAAAQLQAQAPRGPRPLAVRYAGPAGTEQVPSNNLWVQGLPPTVTQPVLSALMEGCGFSVQRIKMIPDTKGYGTIAAMVMVGSQEQAASAIQILNGQVVDQAIEDLQAQLGTAATVASTGGGVTAAVAGAVGGGYAAGGGYSGGGHGGRLRVNYKGDGTPSDNLYIQGLPGSTTQEQLVATLEGLGHKVLRSKILNNTNGTGPSVAMVQFTSLEEATAAMQKLDGQVVQAAAVEEPAQVAQVVGKMPAAVAEMGQQARLAQAQSQLAQSAAVPPLTSPPGTLLVKFKGQDNQPCDQIYIAGLPASIDKTVLDELLQSFGFTVKWSGIIQDTRGTGACCAMVQLASVVEASAAIQSLNGQTVAFEGEPAPEPPPAVQAVQTVQAPAGMMAQGQMIPAVSGGYENAGGKGKGKGKPGTLMVKFKGKDQTPCDSLYIMGLPAMIDDGTFKELFTCCGFTVVWSRVIPDTRGSGTSAGMVQLGSLQEATSAMELLNGQAVEPILATVSGSGAEPTAVQPVMQAAAPMPAAQASAGQLAVSYKGNSQTPCDQIYIRGLHASIVQEQLVKLCNDLGLTVVWSKVIPDTKGFGRSAAMVQFSTVEEATSAMNQLHGQMLEPDEGSWMETSASGGVGGPPGVESTATPAQSSLEVSYAGWEKTPSDNLYIKGLPTSVEKAQLDELLTGFGITVTRSRIIPDTKGTGKCVAMVQVGSMEEASSVISMLDGQTIEFEGSATTPPAEASAPNGKGGGNWKGSDDGSWKGSGDGSWKGSGDGSWKGSSGGSWKGWNGKNGGKGGPPVLSVVYKGKDQTPSSNLYIKGIPASLDQDSFLQVFTDSGFTVVWSRLMPDTKGVGTSVAMVELGNEEEAASAIAMLDGQTIGSP